MKTIDERKSLTDASLILEMPATSDPMKSVEEPRRLTFYRPELDVLRFGAFLMVFWHHGLPHDAAGFSGLARWPLLQTFALDFTLSLGTGLPLFFLLSAYLITTLLMRERARTGTLNMRAFYTRRILRIWPLYFFAILLSFLAAWFVQKDHRTGFYLANLLMVGNWVSAFGIGVQSPLGIGHLWSISVEEQFYLIFPMIARTVSRRALMWVCVLIALIAVFTLTFVAKESGELIWRNSFVQFLMFGAGIALGLRYAGDHLPQWSNRKRVLLIFAALILTIANQHFFHLVEDQRKEALPQLIAAYLLCAAACSMLLLGFLGMRFRFPGWLIYLGKISFGLYVFHAWGLSLATHLMGSSEHHKAHSPLTKDLLALVVTIGFAALSYRWLETPFLKLKDRFAVIHSRPV